MRQHGVGKSSELPKRSSLSFHVTNFSLFQLSDKFQTVLKVLFLIQCIKMLRLHIPLSLCLQLGAR